MLPQNCFPHLRSKWSRISLLALTIHCLKYSHECLKQHEQPQTRYGLCNFHAAIHLISNILCRSLVQISQKKNCGLSVDQKDRRIVIREKLVFLVFSSNFIDYLLQSHSYSMVSRLVLRTYDQAREKN